MKHKTIYGVISLIILLSFFTACSVSKEAQTQKQIINGDWVLESINVEGLTGSFNTKVFNEASLNCFIGSNWHFFANTSSGTYNLSGTSNGCGVVRRNIKWSIYEPKNEEKKFQFKRLDDKGNGMDDNSGFRLTIASLTTMNMKLISNITIENKPGKVVYNFIKK